MDEFAFILNSSASYDDLVANGEPSLPLPFDRPTVGLAERVDATVFNPVTHDVLEVTNIIYERHPDGRPPDRAYWVGRKLRKCIYGVVKECTVLRFRNDVNVPWEVTPAKVAVKIMSWQKINEVRHIEDPYKEVAAMQYICRETHHPHVMGVLDVLCDDDYLLLFMPYCNSGDLFGFVQQAGRFPEQMARYWFRQVLEVGKLECLIYLSRCLNLNLFCVAATPGSDSFATHGRLSPRHESREHFSRRIQDIGDHRFGNVLARSVCVGRW
jgi:hypothetical protein